MDPKVLDDLARHAASEAADTMLRVSAMADDPHSKVYVMLRATQMLVGAGIGATAEAARDGHFEDCARAVAANFKHAVDTELSIVLAVHADDEAKLQNGPTLQ